MKPTTFKQRLASQTRKWNELKKKGELPSTTREWGKASLREFEIALSGGAGLVKKPVVAEKTAKPVSGRPVTRLKTRAVADIVKARSA